VDTALIAAVSSLVIALVTAWQNRRTQTKVHDLAQLAAVGNARLDYEYEARKDLYKTAEPLLFRFNEQCQELVYRVLSLARTARIGHIGSEHSWLAGPGYYMNSTVYTLVAPLATFRLLQRRMTAVDVGLDESIGWRYYVARAIYPMLSEHHDLATLMSPEFGYDPNTEDVELIARSPERYRRQGVGGQMLDAAAEALLVDGESGVTRVKTFSEFDSELGDDPYDSAFAPVYEIFEDFHPRTRPVLWCVLVTQAHLCALYIAKASRTVPWGNTDDFDISKRTVDFDWRSSKDTASALDAIQTPARVAQEYMASRVPWALTSEVS
jgi:hypothetical protein